MIGVELFGILRVLAFVILHVGVFLCDGFELSDSVSEILIVFIDDGANGILSDRIFYCL